MDLYTVHCKWHSYSSQLHIRLQLREKDDVAKLGMNETADLWFARERSRKSYASLLTKPGDEEHTIDLLVSAALSKPVNCPCNFCLLTHWN